jgi:hypothetical protein
MGEQPLFIFIKNPNPVNKVENLSMKSNLKKYSPHRSCSLMRLKYFLFSMLSFGSEFYGQC